MEHNVSTLVATLAVGAVLSGCASSISHDSSMTPTTPTASGTPAPWQIQTRQTLGCYVGFQVPFAKWCLPDSGYCGALSFDTPKGATRLNLTFTYRPFNSTDGTGGMMGFGVKAPDGDPWVDYPTGDLNDPVGTAFDQQRMADNPKRLSFDSPEPGTWSVYGFSDGPTYQHVGNLTIDIRGVSLQTPSSLNVETRHC